MDPQTTDPDAIGAAVTDGAVTLTGHVPTYAEKSGRSSRSPGRRMLFPFGTQAEIASRDPSRTSDVAVHRKQQSGDEANKRAREVDQ